ncbi:MBL fold metallo-hydrolase [Candidatus Woesearchaeota archaeon]|nr:MAG: MBL fold metallo-hydrolase [Candidatus Woesearchaeota archaeon]
MGLEILPVGGYSEIGRNCVAVKVDSEVVLLDLGLLMDKFIELSEEREDLAPISGRRLIDHGAAPDVSVVKSLRGKVVAIIPTHGHLDHIGAIPYLAGRFSCPVHSSPFTIEVIRRLLNDQGVSLRGGLVAHPVNSTFALSKNIKVEFISVTHSIPQTIIVVLHTPYGKVMYCNDFKLDNAPILGQRTNVKRLLALQGKVKVLIMDSLYAHADKKCPSESIAKEMLKDVLLGVNSTGRVVIVTTFSSHIARLKTLVDLAEKLGRKPVFLGRSIAKYVDAAHEAKIIDLKERVETVPFSSKVPKFLRKIKDFSKYLFIMTGHQGEPNAMLSKVVDRRLMPLKDGDHVVFSCTVIPVPINIENRMRLEEKLKARHVRIFKDIHVSGHAMREDHRDFLEMVRPEHIIPTHGSPESLHKLKELAMELGYLPKNVHILHNGERVVF